MRVFYGTERTARRFLYVEILWRGSGCIIAGDKPEQFEVALSDPKIRRSRTLRCAAELFAVVTTSFPTTTAPQRSI